ncbi:MAG: hypothetical protein LH650_12165 [Chloroflexi bacterium]|nr:hypothetical protein [Chloroflexota bacterium]
MLAIVGVLQWNQLKAGGDEARRQTGVFDRQATAIAAQAASMERTIELQRDAVDLQGEVLREMQAERAERDPFAIDIERKLPAAAGIFFAFIANKRTDRALVIESQTFEEEDPTVKPRATSFANLVLGPGER